MTDEVPVGWATARPLELADLVRGVSYKAGEASSEPAANRLPLLRATNIAEHLVFEDLQHVPTSRVSPAQLLRQGDVLIAMSSGSKSVVGKAASLVEPWTGTFGAFCGVLRPSALMDAGYFGLYFKTRGYRDTISALSAGTNINNLKREYFSQLSIPLPPLPEQERIVARVEQLLAHVGAAREQLARVPAFLARFRQSVLAAACAGRLTDDWRTSQPELEGVEALIADLKAQRPRRWLETGRRGRYAEPVVVDADCLPEIPASWRWLSLDALATKVVDGVHRTPRYVPRGVPFVTVRNLTAGSGIDFRQLNYVSQADHRSFCQRANPERGDILISKDGTLGVVRAVRTDQEFSIFVSVALVKLVQPAMTDYTELALSCPQVQQRMVATGSGLQHLHLRDLKAVPVPVPPLAEQRAVVQRARGLLSLADLIEGRLANATARCAALSPSILARAFGGELVRTEAEVARAEGRDYESAAALLNRIRAERMSEPRDGRVGAGVSPLTPRKRQRRSP